ncbi:hypothetical protein [Clostridium merdae]|uniref:hypothetical protein n=1 Tax=Clostridium merdae TaxID=1958780 RepID=UPI000A26A1DE|nr:hypothetical protein [Clostridium merdae]
MDMTRDFLNGILDNAAPHEIDYAGRKFVDRHMDALPQTVTASALNTSTLTSIVDYITSQADAEALQCAGKFIVHVVGHDCVKLYKELNADKKRDSLISASIDGCKFQFGQFMSVEQFIINLQALFVQDDNTAKLLKFISSVKDDTSVQQKDDGVTQKIVANSGVSLAVSATVPNPVDLRPYRTFAEIEQPESAFVFRVRKDERYGVTAALFEADGAAWKNEAILEIKDFLKSSLPEDVIILA